MYFVRSTFCLVEPGLLEFSHDQLAALALHDVHVVLAGLFPVHRPLPDADVDLRDVRHSNVLLLG